MIDRKFARIRKGLSWHVVAANSRVGLVTVCGRWAPEPVREVLPAGDPTCNSCLAIIVRRDEQLAERAKPNEDPEQGDDDPTVTTAGTVTHTISGARIVSWTRSDDDPTVGQEDTT